MDWLIGHLLGDYLFQNDWMALNKKEKSWRGELACHVHVTIWTLCVLWFTGWWDWLHFALVYIPHYIQDRTQIVQWYVNKINRNKPATWLYIINDNVLHLLTLYLIDKYI